MRAAEAADETLSETAPAKLNLTLSVTGRRADGYHELESLVAFAGLGDRLTVAPAADLSLAVEGPFAGGLSTGPDNLVLGAAGALARAQGCVPAAALRLVKALPVAAGLGGGSADAAAALRLLGRLWRVPVPPELAAGLGADVPVCLAAPAPQVMRGTGGCLAPAPALPELWAVLVNPGVPVPTGRVFAALESFGPAGPAPPERFPDFAALLDWLRAGRNDLEVPARALCPAVAEVLAALAPAPLARMSGSGATCFALHPGRADAEAQAADLRRARPAWWVAATPLRRGGRDEPGPERAPRPSA